MNTAIVILDTNVILNDPQAFFAFTGSTVIIHFLTLNELDSFKKESNERGYNAREAIRIIEEMRLKGSLSDGVVLENGSLFKIYMGPYSISYPQLRDTVDDHIICLGLELKKSFHEVKIISRDITLRIKANQFGIDVDDFHVTRVVSKDNFYQGWQEFYYPSGDIKFGAEKILKEIFTKHSFNFNEFIILRSTHQDSYYRIFRYRGKNNYTEVPDYTDVLWGIKGKNRAQQQMVLDLLLDDSVKLVILCGPSGTGKTFLVLTALLYKVLCAQTYQKLLVSRPLVPLGPDIGYLPGDLYEKLQTWMQPVRDNLEYLLYHINSFSKGELCPSEEEYKSKKNKNKHHNDQWHGRNNKNSSYVCLDDLVGHQGKVALEAITYMRGRSIPYQAIFIDEVQNLTAHEVKTLISRSGEGSKIVLVGDPYQIDSPYLDFSTNGLVIASESFKGQEIFGSVYLHISERSILSSLANQLM